MAGKPTDAFDTHFNMRHYAADLEEFYAAVERNKEPDASTVVRRLMADYASGDISYNVTQKED